jgi:hypothetical protein
MKEVSNSARSIVAVLLRSVVWAAVFVIAIGFPAGTVIAQAQSCGNAPLSRLSPGMTAMIIDTTSLSMLDAPDESGNVIATLPRGSVVAVIEGAVCYEGQRMWRVEYGGQLGWITENAQQSYVLQPFGNDSVIAPPPLPTNPAPGLRGSGRFIQWHRVSFARRTRREYFGSNNECAKCACGSHTHVRGCSARRSARPSACMAGR